MFHNNDDVILIFIWISSSLWAKNGGNSAIKMCVWLFAIGWNQHLKKNPYSARTNFQKPQTAQYGFSKLQVFFGF